MTLRRTVSLRIGLVMILAGVVYEGPLLIHRLGAKGDLHQFTAWGETTKVYLAGVDALTNLAPCKLVKWVTRNHTSAFPNAHSVQAVRAVNTTQNPAVRISLREREYAFVFVERTLPENQVAEWKEHKARLGMTSC